jgi:4-hydroxybenzoate polyprenyltransferase
MSPYVEIARIDHWFKNVFILPGVVFALVADPSVLGPRMVWSLGIAAVAVCLAASSNYVLNEVLDARRDRLHPEKRNRPMPSGRVKPAVAVPEWIVLGIVAMVLGFCLSAHLGASIAALLVAGLLYNVPPIRLKDWPYVDVISEAVNNPIRLAVGWYATGCTLSPPVSLLLAYWALGAFLMAVKRFAEYRHIDRARRAAGYRPSFKHYNEPRLLIATMFFATACGMFTGIFIARYHLELVLAVPAGALFMAMYLRLGFKPDSPAQHPERLLRSRSIMTASLALAAIVCFSLWLDSPKLRKLFTPTIPPQQLERPAR